jgi:hypothetical protein
MRLLLALESLKRLAVMRYVFWEGLQRYEAAERPVFGLENHAHPSAPEFS